MRRTFFVTLAACSALTLLATEAIAQGPAAPSPGTPAAPSETAPSNGGGQGVEKLQPPPDPGQQGASPAPGEPHPAQPHGNGCPYRDRKLELIV